MRRRGAQIFPFSKVKGFTAEVKRPQAVAEGPRLRMVFERVGIMWSDVVWRCLKSIGVGVRRNRAHQIAASSNRNGRRPIDFAPSGAMPKHGGLKGQLSCLGISELASQGFEVSTVSSFFFRTWIALAVALFSIASVLMERVFQAQKLPL